MNVKKILKGILPYSVIQNRQARKTSNFLFSKLSSCIHSDDIKGDKCRFKYVIALQGFGYSGHTAILDLLREYKTVLMPSDTMANLSKDKYIASPSIEVDFMRLAGGLIEYEKYLDGSNIFQNDAVLQRMFRLLGTSKFLQLNERCKDLTAAFFYNLIDLNISNLHTPLYNYHLQNNDDPNKNIYFPKCLTLEYYRSLCRDYLTSVWNSFYNDECDKRYIIADHLFSDLSISIEDRFQYVPNLKTIVIYRDPRDVFASSILYDVDWIPHNNVDDFICWWNHMFINFEPDNRAILYVKFEDLILNYELTVKQIEAYLDLSEKDHYYKYQCLNPKSSKNNIFMWKNLCDKRNDIEVIEERLNKYCYYEQ